MSNDESWHRVADFDELDEEEPTQVKIGEKIIAICKLGDEAFAINDICSHEHAFLSDGMIDGDCIECPLHMALFDIKSGEAKTPPATEAIATYPTRLEDGDVWVLV